MRSKRFLQDQRQLLDHAEEARTRAEAMTDADSKIRMLGIAEGYEKQARQEKTLAGVKFNPKLDVEVTSELDRNHSARHDLLSYLFYANGFLRAACKGYCEQGRSSRLDEVS